MRVVSTLILHPSSLILLMGVFLVGCRTTGETVGGDSEPAGLRADIDTFLDRCKTGECPVTLVPNAEVDTVVVRDDQGEVEVAFGPGVAERPWRPADVRAFEEQVEEVTTHYFPDLEPVVMVDGVPLRELVPNLYRDATIPRDPDRLPTRRESCVDRGGAVFRPDSVLVRSLDRPWSACKGLEGMHIALWPSHGWYYEQTLDRWEWQRARLFQTVEDLLPFAFVQPYLLPMLENAGAVVMMPRERDTQTHEVIVDNDPPARSARAGDEDSGYREEGTWTDALEPGFAVGSPPYVAKENPFRQGTARISNDAGATATWTPDIPEDGTYAVTISYAIGPNHTEDARYTVHHAGGVTEFSVNQTMGGRTWVYLGTFRFSSEPGEAKVVLMRGDDNGTLSGDAVRFGGGMGNIARGGTTSGRPRFVEAARYYEQYAGMPDSVYHTTKYPLEYDDNDKVDKLDDYQDDYQSRGEWVNYLRGAPLGPNVNQDATGLRIPIDLSLAFHTDAGVTRNDTTVGTLLIYRRLDGFDEPEFPNGVSRLASRDFADILQTQIVEDIRTTYDPAWNRRPIWDKPYSEATRPNVPSALLELLSHQNYLDMRFALDPRFRFDASRALYKGILRYLADAHGFQPVVQPLPVDHFQATIEGEAVRLRWQFVEDPLEPTATRGGYMVYTREGDGGWDNGRLVAGEEAEMPLPESDVVTSYKVVAVNKGGASFPSEILSVGVAEGDEATPVLVVNGFDRVAPPAGIEEGNLLGFWDLEDQGVPDRVDVSYVGSQYNFDQDSEWIDDDQPGHGASRADYETTLIAGNTFDFPAVHGEAILAAGRSFVSASNEAVMDGSVDLGDYEVVDLILGEQKKTPWPKPIREPEFEAFPAALQAPIRAFLASGGGLFVSGAHVGTDLFAGKDTTHADVVFGRDVLHFSWRTDKAASRGDVVAVTDDILQLRDTVFFNTELGPELYAVESPDGLTPADENTHTILRYGVNSISAGIAHRSDHAVVAFGFPFEAVKAEEERNRLMAGVLAYFEGPNAPRSSQP